MQLTVVAEVPPTAPRPGARRFLRFARAAAELGRALLAFRLGAGFGDRRSELKQGRWFFLLLPALYALKPGTAEAYPGQGVVEGSRVLFGTLAVLALIGTIFASIFNRQYVREAMYSLVATFTLFAIVSWAPQLVSLVQQ